MTRPDGPSPVRTSAQGGTEPPQSAGHPVVCSCGWVSRTGGAIFARVEEAFADHLFREAYRLRREREFEAKV